MPHVRKWITANSRTILLVAALGVGAWILLSFLGSRNQPQLTPDFGGGGGGSGQQPQQNPQTYQTIQSGVSPTEGQSIVTAVSSGSMTLKEALASSPALIGGSSTTSGFFATVKPATFNAQQLGQLGVGTTLGGYSVYNPTTVGSGGQAIFTVK